MIPEGVDFYALKDLPNLQCGPLEVIWDGRLLEVARAFLPGSRKLAWWCREDDGELVRLPPARSIAFWSAEPQAWRPLHPRWTWPDGVPKPLERHQVPRFTYGRQKFEAVEQAEAAELAREMEADRETARAQRENSDGGKTGESRKLWWLDQTVVRYDPIGSIEARHAEARVMRALAQEDFTDEIAGLGLREQRVIVIEDEKMASDLALAEARNPPAKPPRFEPSPADGRDYLLAMSWYTALVGRNAQKVLRIASRMDGFTFGEIGDALGGVSRAGAQIAYRRAIRQVHAIANGAKTAGVRARDKALAEVQERNRAARVARGAM